MKTKVSIKACVIRDTLLFTLSLGLFVSTIDAKEVTLRYKELELNANLELGTNNKIDEDVILITHGGLAHSRMEIVTYLQNLFSERGFNSLAINLSLGIDNRHGMYDCATTHRHQQTDTSDEIDAWMKWLYKQGAKQVILLGHSRGGLQTALYASERDNSRVKAVILLAPATRDNSSADDYLRRHNKPLAPILAKAQQLLDAGKGDSILEHTDILSCRDTKVTAASFVSYYRADPRLDTPYLIPSIHKPTLVVIAGNDEVVNGLKPQIEPLSDGVRVQWRVIAGADHFFRDLNADDAVEAMVEFLQGLK